MSICWEKLQEYAQQYNVEVEEERVDVVAAIKQRQASHLEFAVIGANITRQIFLARQFAQNPKLWTTHLAPAFLRCMYEINVRVMWLVDEPEKNCKAFIKSSVKETEQFAGTVSQLTQNQPTRADLPKVQAGIDEWLKDQSAHFDSTGGGKLADVRKMAEKLQGDALKMYRLYNSSLSPAVHSSWNFVERVNLTHSTNPLHRYLLIPRIEFPPPDVEYFLSTAYFADQCLQVGRGGENDKSAFKKLLAKLTSNEAECQHTE